MMGRFSANDNYVLRRSERLGLSVMFFVLFSGGGEWCK